MLLSQHLSSCIVSLSPLPGFPNQVASNHQKHLPSFSEFKHRATSKRMIGVDAVAVKVLKLTDENTAMALREVEYLKMVQGHENVVAFYDDKIKHGKKLSIMTELARCNFYHIVYEGGPIESLTAKRFSRQLLEGVDHIHSCGIAHCDIKLENLLLGSDGLLKITDFGLALPYVKSEQHSGHGYFEYAGFIGTRMTAAPEVVQGSSNFAPVKNDIWACGVVIMEFLTGRPDIWQQASLEDPAFRHFIEDGYSPLEGADDEFVRFILQVDPRKRPLIFRILKQPWLQEAARKRSSSYQTSEEEDEGDPKKTL
ncbi:hypothetical protein L596_014084 [Steinernema carpocapsae]|uniref:Protein kinase domain-containing protein n=2 Tax=Steinernema carpocapsae TaxID=34508 RepID=A0A4U5NAJ7_STECR|nr:hypothetical protein L596_014084 [Steinernema carpocapsae]